MGLGQSTASSSFISRSLSNVKQGYTCEEEHSVQNHASELALDHVERLLSLMTEQIKRFGQALPFASNLVLGLLRIQKHRGKYPKLDRRGLATIVANVDDWGESAGPSMIHTMRNFWIKNRIIPESKSGKHVHKFS